MTVRLLWVGTNGSESSGVDGTSIADELPSATVSAATTTDAALETLAADAVDCVVTDHEPPEIDAITLTERIDARWPELPVIVAPTEGSESVATMAVRAGAADYVGSGEGLAALADRVDRAVTAAPDRPDCCRVLDAIGDGVAVFDADRLDADAVDRWLCAFQGCRHADATDCSIERVEAASQPGETMALFDRAAEDGSARGEWYCEIDGERRWTEIDVELVSHRGRQRLVVVARDVTDRKRRERRLRTFREAVEHAGHSIYVTRTDGTIEYANPAFEETTGYDAEMAVGKTPSLLKSGVHDRAFYQELWGTITDGEVWNDRIVNRTADGETYVANQTIAPITDAEGEIERFVAINADVTERQRRERQLRALHEAVTAWLGASDRRAVARLACRQVESITELDLIGVLLADPSGDRLDPVAISERAQELFPEPPSFDAGEGVVWRVYERGEPAVHDDVREDADVFNPETPIRSEIVCPLGEHGVILVGSETESAFDDWDQALVGIVASSLEATFDRLERERTIADRNERLEQFTSVVSHDLRNPLSVAMGRLEFARERREWHHLDDVDRALGRIETIVDELLWLARDGADLGDREWVAVADVATDAWEVVETSDAAFELALDADDGGQYVRADANRLQQLFENLFRNAVEHVGADVTVRVGPLPEGGFYVADDGPGIPADERPQVFESGYTTADDGTGLGLAIVDTVVEAHGWSIEVGASESGGARFEIRTDQA